MCEQPHVGLKGINWDQLGLFHPLTLVENDAQALQPEWEQLGAQLAMQVAAGSPAYLDQASIPAEIVSKERALAEEEAAASGKPPEIASKIAQGVVSAMYSTVDVAMYSAS
eukprot:SAG31_NODE_5513_length_2485_cov_2.063286_4_plen_111_part_00